MVVGRKRAYPVDLAHCRVRLQVAGLSWVSKAGSGPQVSRQSSRVVSAVEAESPGVTAATLRQMPARRLAAASVSAAARAVRGLCHGGPGIRAQALILHRLPGLGGESVLQSRKELLYPC